MSFFQRWGLSALIRLGIPSPFVHKHFRCVRQHVPVHVSGSNYYSVQYTFPGYFAYASNHESEVNSVEIEGNLSGYRA